MGLVINNNVTALNAWRNLSTSNTKLGKSLEKLSSGLQINRGGDNPAGLVISEKLRAQATGLKQAVQNAEDAVSVIQVAEGALQEVHSILNSIRALAVHAANEGANDTDSIAADQSQVDNAIEAISRIANTTKFLGKFLLNGGAGNTATVTTAGADNVSSVSLGTVLTAGSLSYSISSAATQGSFTADANGGWSGQVASGDTTITIGSTNIAVTSGDSFAEVKSNINAVSATTGVQVTGTDQMTFTANEYGTGYNTNGVTIGTDMFGLESTETVSTAGTDVAGTINGKDATGTGLTLASDHPDWNNTSVTLTTTGNVSNGVSTDISVTKNELKFSIGGNATADELVTFGINDMRADKLGSADSGFLDNTTSGIKSSQGNSLSNNASGAVAIIDDAIEDVSNERSKLGAYQKNAIESMQNNLGATLENIQAAESRIRDLDMAKEMMEFTKNQILIQAGTAMLAQANQIPQSALQLLQ